MLTADNVSKSFKLPGGGICSPLKGVSLVVGEGEKVAVVGKSGEGKSTLARIICGLTPPDGGCGLTPPDGGNVYVDGKPLFDAKRRYDRVTGKTVQVVPQHPFASLDPVQPVGRAISEALRVSRRAADRSQAQRMTEELLECVQLEKDIATRVPAQISGGQAQRIAIARALAVNPSVLISDEATAMLDVSSQAQILALFDRLVTTRKLSVLFISHDEAVVEAFADRRYRLTDGILCEIVKETQ